MGQDGGRIGDQGTVAALATPEGAALLADATAHDEDAHARAARGDAGAVDPLRAAAALRAAHPGVDPGLVAAALTQARLRRRARPRLGELADRVLLTEDGLEQATRTVVADLRARRYAEAGATHVADLGCGLGLDSLAFARAGLHVTAVERDPILARLAAHNVESVGVGDRVRVVVGDVTDPDVLDVALRDADSAFADPARRDPSTTREGRSRRLSDPADWSPPWAWVEALAGRVPRTAVKAAPGIDHAAIPPGGCGTWTSVDGQLVEAEISWPGLVADGMRRRAVVLRRDVGSTIASGIDLDDEQAPPVGPVGTWLLEPDDAVIRSGLVGAFAASVGGRLLDPRVAYVTTDTDARPPTAFGAAFRVRHALPYDLRTLRSRLVEDGVGHVVVKRRAISADPDDVRRRLALPKARGSAVVLLTRIGVERWAFVCDTG
jgi:SAM-dependent methyltransferase